MRSINYEIREMRDIPNTLERKVNKKGNPYRLQGDKRKLLGRNKRMDNRINTVKIHFKFWMGNVAGISTYIRVLKCKSLWGRLKRTV